MIELVPPIIKFVVEPLEVGPEFAFNSEVAGVGWADSSLPCS